MSSVIDYQAIGRTPQLIALTAKSIDTDSLSHLRYIDLNNASDPQNQINTLSRANSIYRIHTIKRVDQTARKKVKNTAEATITHVCTPDQYSVRARKYLIATQRAQEGNETIAPTMSDYEY